MRILIAAGGTGGHIYPALAVLRRTGDQVGWILRSAGSAVIGGSNRPIVPAAGYRPRPAVAALAAVGRPVRGTSSPTRFAWRHPSRRRPPSWLAGDPTAIYTTGGYVAIPVLTAAAAAARPVAPVGGQPPGGTERARDRPLASAIAVTFAGTREALPGQRFVTGTPIRSIAGIDRAEARVRLELPPDLPVLLVFGGSQAVRRLNRAVAEALPELVERVTVVHLTGESAYAEALRRREALPAEKRGRYRPHPFLRDEMADALVAADLLVGRAGSSTLAEATAVGTAARGRALPARRRPPAGQRAASWSRRVPPSSSPTRTSTGERSSRRRPSSTIPNGSSGCARPAASSAGPAPHVPRLRSSWPSPSGRRCRPRSGSSGSLAEPHDGGCCRAARRPVDARRTRVASAPTSSDASASRPRAGSHSRASRRCASADRPTSSPRCTTCSSCAPSSASRAPASCRCSLLGRGSDLVISDAGIRGLVVHNRAQQTRIEGDRLIADAGLPMAQGGDHHQGRRALGHRVRAGHPGHGRWRRLGERRRARVGRRLRCSSRRASSAPTAARNGSTRPASASPTARAVLKHAAAGAPDVVTWATFQLEAAEPGRHRGTTRRDPSLAPGAPAAGHALGRQRLPQSLAGATRPAASSTSSASRGVAIGGASVSEKHANFIVNDQKGSAADVRRLGERGPRDRAARDAASTSRSRSCSPATGATGRPARLTGTPSVSRAPRWTVRRARRVARLRSRHRASPDRRAATRSTAGSSTSTAAGGDCRREAMDVGRPQTDYDDPGSPRRRRSPRSRAGDGVDRGARAPARGLPRASTGPSARTARSRPCARSAGLSTADRALRRPQWAWTRRSSSASCGALGCRSLPWMEVGAAEFADDREAALGRLRSVRRRPDRPSPDHQARAASARASASPSSIDPTSHRSSSTRSRRRSAMTTSRSPSRTWTSLASSRRASSATAPRTWPSTARARSSPAASSTTTSPSTDPSVSRTTDRPEVDADDPRPRSRARGRGLPGHRCQRLRAVDFLLARRSSSSRRSTPSPASRPSACSRCCVVRAATTSAASASTSWSSRSSAPHTGPSRRLTRADLPWMTLPVRTRGRPGAARAAASGAPRRRHLAHPSGVPRSCCWSPRRRCIRSTTSPVFALDPQTVTIDGLHYTDADGRSRGRVDGHVGQRLPAANDRHRTIARAACRPCGRHVSACCCPRSSPSRSRSARPSSPGAPGIERGWSTSTGCSFATAVGRAIRCRLELEDRRTETTRVPGRRRPAVAGRPGGRPAARALEPEDVGSAARRVAGLGRGRRRVGHRDRRWLAGDLRALHRGRSIRPTDIPAQVQCLRALLADREEQVESVTLSLSVDACGTYRR